MEFLYTLYQMSITIQLYTHAVDQTYTYLMNRPVYEFFPKERIEYFIHMIYIIYPLPDHKGEPVFQSAAAA